jgi:hypothetical protein
MEDNTIEFNELEQVEAILQEAHAFGMRWEVQEFAEKFMEQDPDLTRLEATMMAYDEWIK